MHHPIIIFQKVQPYINTLLQSSTQQQSYNNYIKQQLFIKQSSLNNIDDNNVNNNNSNNNSSTYRSILTLLKQWFIYLHILITHLLQAYLPYGLSYYITNQLHILFNIDNNSNNNDNNKLILFINPNTDQLNSLPDELLQHILSYIHINDLYNLRLVNKQLSKFAIQQLNNDYTYLQQCKYNYSWLRYTQGNWSNVDNALYTINNHNDVYNHNNVYETTYHGIAWRRVYNCLNNSIKLSDTIQQTVNTLNQATLLQMLSCSFHVNVLRTYNSKNTVQYNLYNNIDDNNKQQCISLVLGLYASLPPLLFKLLICRNDDVYSKLFSMCVSKNYKAMSIDTWTETLLLPLYLLLDISLLTQSDSVTFNIQHNNTVDAYTQQAFKSKSMLPFTLLTHFIHNLKLNNSKTVQYNTFLSSIQPTLKQLAYKIEIVYNEQLNQTQINTLQNWKKYNINNYCNINNTIVS